MLSKTGQEKGFLGHAGERVVICSFGKDKRAWAHQPCEDTGAEHRIR